ncbi:MAG: hypothetical protein EOO14_10285 [Chitinophagaceae bacterium]|nr:MAG: hypothetical protein EOO14_10285 [Chitinophagaceae bacterium]
MRKAILKKCSGKKNPMIVQRERGLSHFTIQVVVLIGVPKMKKASPILPARLFVELQGFEP